MNTKKLFAAGVTALVLAACGGGGGGGGGGDSGGGSGAGLLQAVAKAPRCALTGDAIALDAASSTGAGTTASYAWTVTQRPAGSAAAIANPASSTAGFTPDVSGDYRLQLTVTQDGTSSQAAVALQAGEPGPLEEAEPTVAGGPRISVSMREGRFAVGCLFLHAKVASNEPGRVSLSIMLLDGLSPATETEPISGAYGAEQTGLPPSRGPIAYTETRELRVAYDVSEVSGPRTVRFEASDSGRMSIVRRSVTIVHAGEPAYEPALVMASGARLEALEGRQVLVVTPTDTTVYTSTLQAAELRDLVSGARVPLQGVAGMARWSAWMLDGGRVFVEATAADCPGYCIYMWAPDGSRTNLSTASPVAPAGAPAAVYHRSPLARAGHVLWGIDRSSGPDSYMLYEVATGSYREFALQPGVDTGGYPTLALAGGQVRVHYLASNERRVYRWDSGSGTNTLANDDGTSKAGLVGDDTRVAWTVFGAASNGDNQLYTMPVTGGPTTLPGNVYTISDRYQLADGLLAWDERGSAGERPRVRVLTAAGAIETVAVGSLLAVGDGRVAYDDDKGVVVWTAASQQTKRILEIADRLTVGGPYLTGANTAVFTIGRAVYYVPL